MKKSAIFFCHIFKCAGTTFNLILESNYQGRVLYAEKPDGTRGKLKRESLADFLRASKIRHHAISSHSAEPTCSKLAKIGLTLLRNPRDRNWSAFHFEKKQGLIDHDLSYSDYLAINHNYQTRILTEGLGGKDLNIGQITNYFEIGIIERFDESMIAFEWILEQKGIHVDFAFPQKLNAQSYKAKNGQLDWQNQSERLQAEVEAQKKFNLDQRLYQRVNQKLNATLAKIPNLQERIDSYFKRNAEKQSEIESKPVSFSQSPKTFTYIAPTTRAGMLPGHENKQPRCDYGSIQL